MKISIVIPVYNEADSLDACLQAIRLQTVKPLEVIVVDNNSTDQTRAVARRYSFVKLMSEPKQGVVHARAKGFDAAKGEIIGRIDADTILPSNWVASVVEVFKDESLAATSGAANYYNVAISEVFNAIDLFFRRRLEKQLSDAIYLWGANMAMRKSAWKQVRSSLCWQGDMHEDYDIAIHLQRLGHKVSFNEIMQAYVSSRRIDVNYLEFMRYVLISPKTYAKHGIRSRWHMYSVVAVCAVGYLPARILHRGYDPLTDQFSWHQLATAQPAVPRVDPTSNVA